MSKAKRYSLVTVGFFSLLTIFIIVWISQATQTRHSAVDSTLGKNSNRQALIESLKSGATVSLKTIKSANWEAPLSDLLNLDDPKVKLAGLEDHGEAIQIYAYHLQHPVHGDFLIDTGVSKQLLNDPQSQGIPNWLEPLLGLDKMELLIATEDYIKNVNLDLKGVFLTHLHLDHISGMPAIEKQVPLYIGQGETTEKYFTSAATRGTVDTILDGRPNLQKWTAKYVDVFSDGSLFAIHSPGHTAGSTAYLVNTINGPVLLTGDAVHTTWGWSHGVESGHFSIDKVRSRESLNTLIQLVKEHPEIEVRTGHQSF